MAFRCPTQNWFDPKVFLTTVLGIVTIFKSAFCPNSSCKSGKWMSTVLTLCFVHRCGHYWDLFILMIASQKIKFKLSQDFWAGNTELGLRVDSEASLWIGNKGDEFISDISVVFTIELVVLNLGTSIISVMWEIAISPKAAVTFQLGHVIGTDFIECSFLLWMFLKIH